jgi:bacillolysin
MIPRILNFLFLSALLLFGKQTSFTQVKNIKFDPNAKVDLSNVNINFKPQISKPRIESVTYKTAFHSGIKPGYTNSQGLPSYFEGKIPTEKQNRTSLKDAAIQYIEYAKPLMKIRDEKITFDLVSQTKDDLGIDHLRFNQKYNGVPIYGAEVIVHGRDGDFDFLNGSYYNEALINTTPSITVDQATAAMISDRGEAIKYKNFMGPLTKLMEDQKELVIYNQEGEMKLVYHFTTYRNLAERYEYFVEAHSGAIIHKHESLCKFHNHSSSNQQPNEETFSPPNDGATTANALDLFDVSRSINTYQVGNSFYLIDGSRDIFSSTPSQLPDDPEGVIWTIDAFNTSPQKDNFKYDHIKSGNNAWNNKTGVSAHYNGGKAFEYFRTVHSRKSINGQGGNIISLINVAEEDGGAMDNAFWNGQAMFYGNGKSDFRPLARGLDVAGHEMTHGVVQSTANLEYQGESGALNESFADIFGAMIDRDDWLIGEDVVKTSSFPSGALRSLQDPHNGGTNLNSPGYQPRIYSERYTGSQDNGGVHINSGIPNWAFFKFATAVGKDKAEKVFYRALANYLTKSSKFIDCRVAVIKAATDLYGATEVTAARKAFDDVGIFGESSGDYENDASVNPGLDLVLVTDLNDNGLYILDGQGTNLGKITNKGVLSRPSVSDDGSYIVFAGKDNKMHLIYLDWTMNPVIPEEDILEDTPIWRNVIISKDASKIAALTTENDNKLIVFYLGSTQTLENEFDLYNPTFTNGQQTGDVNYADAMEFDITGEYIMYDAENEISSLSNGSISYWDISFIKVWNNASETFSLGKVEKLYSSLPEGVSVGNPTFSKNSPYIIAFDYIEEDGTVTILGANIERGEAKLIFDNDDELGYPNYSSDDKKMVFDALNTSGNKVVGITNLKANKIEPQGNAAQFVANRHWAVWFSNGKRELSSIGHVDPNVGTLTLQSNPVGHQLEAIARVEVPFSGTINVSDIAGKLIYTQQVEMAAGLNNISINVDAHPAGSYLLSLVNDKGISTVHYVK